MCTYHHMVDLAKPLSACKKKKSKIISVSKNQHINTTDFFLKTSAFPQPPVITGGINSDQPFPIVPIFRGWQLASIQNSGVPTYTVFARGSFSLERESQSL